MSGRDRAGGGGSARPAERPGRACVAGCWYLKPGLFSRSCQSGAVPISTPGRSANGTRSVGAGALQSGSDSGDCGSGTAKEQFAAALEDPSASVLDVFDQARAAGRNMAEVRAAYFAARDALADAGPPSPPDAGPSVAVVVDAPPSPQIGPRSAQFCELYEC